ncbi:hypothetical protein D3C81_2150550 [compost metagenome]
MPGLREGQALPDQVIARVVLVESDLAAAHAVVEGLDVDRQYAAALDAKGFTEEAKASHIRQPSDFVSLRGAVQQ